MRPRLLRPAKAAPVSMTPMIDIVFLLLVFFVMTFQIVVPEGDFSIEMSQPASSGPPPIALPLDVYLAASEDGSLAELRLGDRKLRSMEDLAAQVRQLAELQQPASPEVHIHSQSGLHYKHLMDAMSAISGYVDERGQIVSLDTKVRLVKQ